MCGVRRGFPPGAGTFDQSLAVVRTAGDGGDGGRDRVAGQRTCRRDGQTWGDWAKVVGGLIPVIAAAWLIASAAGRFVLLDSRRSARAFFDARADPMEDLAGHFDWLLRQAGRPVMLLIDDLDRCAEHLLSICWTRPEADAGP